MLAQASGTDMGQSHIYRRNEKLGPLTMVLLATAILLVTQSPTLSQPTADEYKPGDPPQCNTPFAGSEFRAASLFIADDFTLRNKNLKNRLSDHFISTWQDGEVLNKQQFLGLQVDPKLKIKKIHVQRESYNACLYGYLAVVTGVYVLDGSMNDQDLSAQYRFTAVYAKHPSGWLLEALHSSRIVRPIKTIARRK